MTELTEEISASTAKMILGVASEATIYRYAKLGLLTERVEQRGLRVRKWYKRSEVEALKEELAKGVGK